jgi:hypothetical protein
MPSGSRNTFRLQIWDDGTDKANFDHSPSRDELAHDNHPLVNKFTHRERNGKLPVTHRNGDEAPFSYFNVKKSRNR